MRRELTLGVAAALLGLAACESATTPPEPPTTPPEPPTGAAFSLAIDSMEISAPGEGRVELLILDSAANPTVTASASLTASIETSGGVVQKHVLVIDASEPGVGYVKLANVGHADSVKVVSTTVTFKRIAVAYGHACGIAQDDRAWCWGENGSEQIGAYTTPPCIGGGCQYYNGGSAKLPIPVEGDRKFSTIAASGKGCNFDGTAGACGETCAITLEGATYCWGVHNRMFVVAPGAFGQDRTMASVAISLSAGVSYYDIVPTPCGLSPEGLAYCLTGSGSVPAGGGLSFTSFGTSSTHSCGVSSGDVYCWGTNLGGEFGTGAADADTHVAPVKAVAPVSFTSVEVADHRTCALGVDHKVYCWGDGEPTPAVLAGAGTYDSIALNMTSQAICGLSASGSVDCWTSFSAQPAAVQSPVAFVSIDVGGLETGAWRLSHCCGLSAAGDVYCWHGELVATKLGAP